MKKYWNWKKTTGLMMACAVICGTTGIALAEEKQDDKASAVETVRTYEGDEGDMTLRINVPQVVGKEGYVAEINDKILDLTTDYEARADWEVAQWTIVNKKDTIFKYIFWERLDSLPIPECCFHFVWCQIA